MPIVVKNKQYVSKSFAGLNQLTFYKANVGDLHSLSFEVESNIRLSSIGNPLLLDGSQNIVTSTSVSWLDEGFRDGDQVRFFLHSSGGAVIQTWTTAISWVNDTEADFNSIPFWINQANQEFIVVYVIGRSRDDLDILVNQVLNGGLGSAASLIDGEISRISWVGLGALPVLGNQSGVLVGNQSGNYLVSAEISRNADIDTFTREYSVTIDYIVQGIHDPTWYYLGGCTKLFVQLLWASIGGEPYDRASFTFSDDADTGWFNEAFNTGVVDSTLIQGVSGEISYCNPTNVQIIVEGPAAPLGIGAAVNILDDSTFKNLPDTAQVNAILAKTTDINTTSIFSSATGANGEQLDFVVNSITTSGSQYTIDLTILPNASFEQFIEARDLGDRQFYLWVRCGNTNHLVYQAQLTCPPLPAGPLTLESEISYFDHNENITENTGNASNIEFNIEDDIGFFATFLLDKNENYDEFIVTIEAFNSVSGEAFTLQQALFNFSSVQISNDGRYLLDESQTVITTLPSNSVKREALLKLYPLIDTGVQYGVSIYYPFLLRWEYWLDQSNASTDFYPNQDKNWFPYDNTGDWEVRTKLQLVKDGQAFEHFREVDILNYDNAEDIISDIQLIRESDGAVVSAIIEGELMRVKSSHINNLANWDPLLTWGMLTIEPTENSPRSICSSVLPFDGNSANPLKPIDNIQMVVTFPAPNVASMECLFNPDLIDITNGCKFTAKIKEARPKIPEGVKTTSPDDLPKTDHNAINKTLAP